MAKRRTYHRRPLGEEDGYAAIDAMVALTIFSIALSLSLVAEATAVKLSSRAEILQGTRTRLIGAVEHSAAGQGITVTLKPEALAGEGEHRLCRVDAVASSIARERSMVLAALRACGAAGT